MTGVITGVDLLHTIATALDLPPAQTFNMTDEGHWPYTNSDLALLKLLYPHFSYQICFATLF
jgi:hypothetical protein